MDLERYPSNTIITKADFNNKYCENVLRQNSANDYYSMYKIFSTEAQKAMNSGNTKQAKIYWLLSDACSLMLTTENKTEPFKPFAIYQDRRSAILDDFSKAEIDFFSEILPMVKNHLLKARLADLTWIKAEKKEVNNALIAIDSYCKISLDNDMWLRGGKECWHRAIYLTIKLRTAAGTRIHDIENKIYMKINASTDPDGYLVLWLSDLLLNFRIGKNKAGDISAKLETLAGKLKDNRELHMLKDYLYAASKWYKLAGNKFKSIEMTIQLAESYANEASAQFSIEAASNLLATSFYEKAIQILRTIPQKDRNIHKIEGRIAEIHKLLNEAGKQSLNEIAPINSPGIDITHIVETAQKHVAGKDVVNALKAFTNLSEFMHIDEMQAEAIQHIKKYPISSLFGGTHLSRDGRVIAKTSGVGFEDILSGDHPNVQATIMRNHSINLSLIVQGYIIPALEILHLEQSLQEDDFLSFIQSSPIVPPGRELLFSKCLFAGYENDFVTALHLLIPQVEHLVRYHLKNAGAKTSTLDHNGIENENGLSTLVELPEMRSIFGDDLTFEIKALFCNPMGANLRNELAHGLIDHNACNSIHGIYAWWLTLKMVFNTFWNAARQEYGIKQEEDING